jgi:hypothetical protein
MAGRMRMTRKTLDNRHGRGSQEDEHLRLASEIPRSTGWRRIVREAKVHTGLYCQTDDDDILLVTLLDRK